MALPGREFYLNDDAKSKEIRDKYREARGPPAGVERRIASPGRHRCADRAGHGNRSGQSRHGHRCPPRSQEPEQQDVAAADSGADSVLQLEPLLRRHAGAAIAAVPGARAQLLPGHGKADRSRTPIEQWRAYLRWSTLHALASSLSQPFVEENFDFFGRTLGGTKEIQPRWRRCSIYADTDLGEAVGQAYVAKYFPPENKERMLQMVKAIKTALDQDIDAADLDVRQNQESGARQTGRAGRQDRLSRSLARLFFGRNQARRLSGQRAAFVGVSKFRRRIGQVRPARRPLPNGA